MKIGTGGGQVNAGALLWAVGASSVRGRVRGSGLAGRAGPTPCS